MRFPPRAEQCVMRDFLRDYDELRPNLPQVFSLLLNERMIMMMMMPWYLECFSLPFIVQVFPSRRVVSCADSVSLPICGTRRASKIRNRTGTCVHAHGSACACAYGVVHQTIPECETRTKTPYPAL